MMNQPELIVERPAEGVALLTLNRPETRNALSTQLLKTIVGQLDALSDDPGVRCTVLTGGSRAFASGADINEFSRRTTVNALTDERASLWNAIRRHPKPLIAAVNGYALGGGCELAMHGDIIVASEKAMFGQPEINLGIVPAAGGTQRLVRLTGVPFAMRLVLTGRPVSAAEAKAAGMVTEVVADNQVLPRAIEIASEIASKPSLAVRLAKQLVLVASDVPLEAGLAFERQAMAALVGTSDFHAAVDAFLRRKQPKP